MREVTMYYAYDDKEFDNYHACIQYENIGYGLALSIANKISFYDKNMEEILPPGSSPDVEDWIKWLDDAYGCCVFCRRNGSFTDDETEFIRENISACIYNEDFSCAVGLFRYDTRTMEWVKVDE